VESQNRPRENEKKGKCWGAVLRRECGKRGKVLKKFRLHTETEGSGVELIRKLHDSENTRGEKEKTKKGEIIPPQGKCACRLWHHSVTSHLGWGGHQKPKKNNSKLRRKEGVPQTAGRPEWVTKKSSKAFRGNPQ